MPQDADGSGLVALIWVAWIYWNIYWWLGHMSSLQRAEQERQLGLLDLPTDAKTLSPSATILVPTGLEALVSEILRRDGAVRIEDFLGERLAAYERIVAAFDSGDRDVLRKLVSPEVFDVFSDAIATREAQRENVETVFSRIEPQEIVGGLIDETHMVVSVRFAGESFKTFRNAAGQLLEGADRCRVIDIWTFARTLSSRRDAWRVVATQAEI